MKLLFKNASILMEDWSVLKDAFLGIDGDTICYIGQDRPQEDYDTEKDMSGKLLMPGIYNMHAHSPMSILRGIGSGLPLDKWLFDAIFPVEARMVPEDISVATRINLMEMIASGTVSFTDMYDQTWVTLDEVDKAGIKANLCRPIQCFDPNEKYEDNFRSKESIKLYHDINAMNNSRIKADFSIHAEYTNHPHIVAAYAEECNKLGGRVHLHLSETKKEHEECKQRHGKTPARFFYDLGTMDIPVIAAHCVWVDDEDLDLLKEKNVTCVHNPTSNMKLGSGFMPIQKMLDKGIRVCIGTDGDASNNNQDMFEEMHMAAVIHKGYHLDPTMLTNSELLTMVTKNGAEAQGRENCGALKVGYKADVIAIDMDRPHFLPAHDIPSLLLYSAHGSDVVMTMVDGKILYENGVFLTIDFEKAKFDLDAAVKRLF
ncbi:MAG: amidohydrolase [Firmicutes bacterium]|nr:amidohydrolase [Bacillota bacterium]